MFPDLISSGLSVLYAERQKITQKTTNNYGIHASFLSGENFQQKYLDEI